MMFLRKNEKGFTLIEVMLVVIIIGIIAISALPKLLVTKKTAEEKSCLSNLQALGTAIEQYKWDYTTGLYPDGTSGSVPTLVGTLTTDGYLPPDSTVSTVCPSDDSSGSAYYSYVDDDDDPTTTDDGNVYCTEHAPDPSP